MIHVIDLIETDEPIKTKAVWKHVCGFLSKQPGFVAGQLLNTVEAIHPMKPYRYTSFCQWESDEHWRRARSAAKEDIFISKVLKDFPAKLTAVQADLDQGHGHDVRRSTTEMMTLVDVIYVDPEQRDSYARMWSDARSYMEDKSGFVDANLYRVFDDANPVKFVNIAVWQNTQMFFDALNTPEFMEIISDFRENFSLYLSRVSATLTSQEFAIS